ncbi:MAG: biopolymer transporter ExbD, partial [Sphingopyxis terrae]
TSDIIRWNGNAVDLAELGQLVKAASGRAVPATLLFEPDPQARYLRVDQAIGAIRRNGGSKIAFPGIQRYGGLV